MYACCFKITLFGYFHIQVYIQSWQGLFKYVCVYAYMCLCHVQTIWFHGCIQLVTVTRARPVITRIHIAVRETLHIHTDAKRTTRGIAIPTSLQKFSLLILLLLLILRLSLLTYYLDTRDPYYLIFYIHEIHITSYIILLQ
jgi:hypothetical protein